MLDEEVGAPEEQTRIGSPSRTELTDHEVRDHPAVDYEASRVRLVHKGRRVPVEDQKGRRVPVLATQMMADAKARLKAGLDEDGRKGRVDTGDTVLEPKRYSRPGTANGPMPRSKARYSSVSYWNGLDTSGSYHGGPTR